MGNSNIRINKLRYTCYRGKTYIYDPTNVYRAVMYVYVCIFSVLSLRLLEIPYPQRAPWNARMLNFILISINGSVFSTCTNKRITLRRLIQPVFKLNFIKLHCLKLKPGGDWLIYHVIRCHLHYIKLVSSEGANRTPTRRDRGIRILGTTTAPPIYLYINVIYIYTQLRSFVNCISNDCIVPIFYTHNQLYVVLFHKIFRFKIHGLTSRLANN